MTDGKAIELFRELLKGGNLSFLNEITPRRGFNYFRKKTEKADYIINYAATDGKSYTVWRISGKAKTAFEMPKYFDTNLGELFYSAYKKAGGPSGIPLKIEKDDRFYIYLMGSVDLNKNDVMRMFP